MTRDEKGPLLVLDGMSLAFRAFFALPDDLATTSGIVTNAVLGFSNMLLYLVREQQPSAMAVAFDLPEATFRDEIVDDYKAGRSETPDILLPQFDMIRGVLAAMAIPILEVPGYEADDVLATLATRWRDQKREVIVVTGDRDTFQLVEDPYVRVLYNRRGVSDYTLYDEAGILERTGVAPVKYAMLAALRGDTSDNLAGVPGVGEKTAAKLLNSYGDIDGIYANVPAQTPKLRQNLAEFEGRVRTNLQLIPLVRDVPLPPEADELALGGWDLAQVRARFEELELRDLWLRLKPMLAEGAFGPPAAGSELPDAGAGDTETEVDAGEVAIPAPIALDPERPGTAAAMVKAIGAVRKAAATEPLAIAGSWEAAAGRSVLRGVALVAGTTTDACWLAGDLLSDPTVAGALGKALDGPFAGHEVKELLRALAGWDVDGRGLVMDTAVAAYLLDPSTGDYGLPEPVAEGPAQLTLEATSDDGSDRAAAAAGTVARLVASYRARLEAEGLASLHDDVETPLVRVLARMEVRGVRVDRAELQRIADALAGDASRLEARVHELAGHEFKVNSTPQLRAVLYDELGLTPGRKTKTGYSTDAATLETLRDSHPIVETLLEYREAEKLRSTYGESLLAEVDDDDRIHATFRQTVARTGRLSSERPNLHNIPVRTEGGRRFRRAFVPAEGWRMVVADYNQIELRVLAHLSGDPGLLEAFASGSDIHRTVAAGIYNVPPEEVTRAQRDRAKMVSFGLAYGMEAFGLARRLATGVDEASEIMGAYFGAFPHVRAYMDATVAEARARGYTRTALGRKRPLPDLNDRNYQRRQAAERQAMNAGIQGLAADIFKTALVRLDGVLESGGLDARLVLQVHDEVIVETPPEEEAEVCRLTESALAGAADLSVPLEVTLATGTSWDDAKAG